MTTTTNETIEFGLTEDGFDNEQLNLIAECKKLGFKTEALTADVDYFKMRLAFLAFKNGNDITQYLKDFNHYQLDEIQLGLFMGVDVTQYAYASISAEDMHMKRICLEDAERLSKLHAKVS